MQSERETTAEKRIVVRWRGIQAYEEEMTANNKNAEMIVIKIEHQLHAETIAKPLTCR